MISKNQKDFSASMKNPLEHGDNTIFIKGGSVIIEDRWVVLSNMRIDVAQLITKYIQETSRRVFNNFNDVLYLLIVLNKTKQIELLPSASFNKKSFGEIKIFDNISGKLPLVLVKLQQDGSSDLKSFKPITMNDIEVYNGYGNYTIRGEKGDDGYKGITGVYGETGFFGITGYQGPTGISGETGLSSASIQGATGLRGADGVSIPAFLLYRDN